MENQYPFDQNFQRKILALMVRDPTFLTRFPDVIRVEYFFGEALRTLSRQILDYHQEHRSTLSMDGMLEIIERHRQYHDLKDSVVDLLRQEVDTIYLRCDLSDAMLVRDRAIEFARDQAIRSALTRVVHEFEKDPKERTPHEEQMDWLLSANRVGNDVRELGMDWSEKSGNLSEILQSSSYHSSRQIMTPYPTINEAMYGGMGLGELMVVLGLSKSGKTMLCINFAAWELFQNEGSVVHYAVGDMYENDVALRYASRLTGCTMSQIVQGDPLYLERYRNLNLGQLQLRIKRFTPGTTRIGQIYSHLSALISGHGFHPRMMVLDYPDQLRGGSGENMYSAMGEIYDQLVEMAEEFHLAIIVPSQISRASRSTQSLGKNEVLTQDHVAHSSQKTSKADIVISINQNREERTLGRGRVHLDTNRRGKSFKTFPVLMDMGRATITECASVESDQENQ